MRAIGRNARLAIPLALMAVSLHADIHSEVIDLFASMTAALSEDNAPGFMKAFDKEMPGYQDLSRQISALLVRAEISCSVEPLKDDGDGVKRGVDLDWYMELKGRQPDSDTERRRKIIHCELAKQGKHWRIVALSPLSFFADKPPDTR